MSKTICILCISLLVIFVKCEEVTADDPVFPRIENFREDIIQTTYNQNAIGRKRQGYNLIRNVRHRRKIIDLSDQINLTRESSTISIQQKDDVSHFPLFSSFFFNRTIARPDCSNLFF